MKKYPKSLQIAFYVSLFFLIASLVIEAYRTIFLKLESAFPFEILFFFFVFIVIRGYDIVEEISKLKQRIEEIESSDEVES